CVVYLEFFFFFFQAEDGIRDGHVTGVQTCALPISFIFGLLPLWVASGAGSVSRRILGTAVITGTLAATAIAIFVIPMLFVVVERLTQRFARREPAAQTMVGGTEGEL